MKPLSNTPSQKRLNLSWLERSIWCALLIVGAISWRSEKSPMPDCGKAAGDMSLLSAAIENYRIYKGPRPIIDDQSSSLGLLNDEQIRVLIRALGEKSSGTIADIERKFTIRSGIPIDPWGKPYQFELIPVPSKDNTGGRTVLIKSVGSGLLIAQQPRE